MKHKKYLALFASVLILGLAGCSSNSANEGSADGETRQEITVGTSGAPKPFSYVGEDEELTGYDIEVVKAIFEELPDYSLTFENTEFTSVLSGLDTNRYQIGANNFALNEERQEKYIYSDPIFENQYVLAVPEDNETIQSFDDLAGLTTEVSPGLNYATALENYNEENPDNQVTINYSEAELLNVLQNVDSGRYGFQLIDKTMGQQFIEEHDLHLKLIDLSEEDSERIGTPYSYLLLSRSEMGEELVDEVNAAIQTLIEDGTLSQISEEFLGDDFAPKDSE